ncbi:TPA: hypothetical protein ACK0TX_002076 [Staphylococcus aureus]|uniref:hypothetical protein n=5 Tax=Staphylococcus aureus TaxID=1280 RepID=UPI00044C12B3|nr:hypothetical protein [Staphylococcus aureus]EYK64054.1 hypothetical protein V636_01960 [Staphylococcus aureus T55954]NGC66339.1 hypothetical protein [Staphylococcus aureus]HAR7315192.1 hypothetical protein [Staphylococcus aureus]HAR7391192.1 hypothetical protein [Staphylococcus aureus]HAR7512412.1 hypothetical protein [Staphylococcus aureus]
MEKNESNITDVTQNEEQLDNSDEQSQQNEKTFSQEEVSQLIKERIARERKKSDERIKDAKENNDSNEVAYLLKGAKVTKVYGDQNSVSFVPGEKATELLFDSKPNSIVMLHNHPGQSGFSLNDLAVFTINNSIKTMTIVTNKGRIKFISKTEHFKEKVMKKMIANLLIEKSLDVISTKDIERLLKELYNNDNII